MNIFAIKNFIDLPVAVRVLFAVVGFSSPDGTFNVSKQTLAEYLKVSKQTVGEHLNTFARCNILKRKYSGKGIFNPDFYYVGPSGCKAQAVENYKKFKSDVETPED